MLKMVLFPQNAKSIEIYPFGDCLRNEKHENGKIKKYKF